MWIRRPAPVCFGAVAALILAGAIGPGAVAAVLEYCCRYLHQSGEPDHLMHAVEIGNGRAVVAGNRGLALIDLDGLPAGGTQSTLFRLFGLNARDVVWDGADLLFVNLHRGETQGTAGFAVVRIIEDALVVLAVVDEPGVLFEKMALSGGRLFIAAHAAGIRVYTVADPSHPIRIGAIEAGFVDAFAVASSGDRLFVADGAGGLKVLDIADPESPVLLGGETLETAIGTAMDVVVRDGDVFVAAGGGGLAVYAQGDPSRRTIVPTGGCAESLAWIGGRLAVGTLDGVVLFDVAPGPVLTETARETAARRGPQATLRICSGVSGASADRALCANWNYVDVYRVVEDGLSDDPDISPSSQRIRFAPEEVSATVTLYNRGAAPLQILGSGHQDPAFRVSVTPAVLAPGDSLSFEVSYDGTGADARDVLRIHSNDPDEAPLPVQLFGRTPYLDPGEPAPDFTLPLLARAPSGQGFVETPFTLSDHRGRIVWFQVYASW